MNMIMSFPLYQPHFIKSPSITTSIPSCNLRRQTRGTLRVVCQKAVVGIDLGTTNSAVATVQGGKPTIITNAEGQRITPSVAVYRENGQFLVGELAKKQALINPENTFFSVRRLLGKKIPEIDDYSKELISYELVGDENGDIRLQCPVARKQFTAEEISAQVVRKLVDDASSFLNESVNTAVVTVPAYFNDSQRTATANACQIAGLDILQIMDEPSAAALAYGFHNKINGTILVFDLGGATLDVSVLQVGDGVVEVLSTSGDDHLGGDDFDKRILHWLAENFKCDVDIDLREDKRSLQLLTETAEKVKMELSTLTQTSISLPFIKETRDPKHIKTTLTRAKFEDLCSDLLQRLKTPVESALRKSKLSFEDIDQVILCGGSTRIPAVQDFVKMLTGKQPIYSVNPDEVVALGAALQANVLSLGGQASDMVLRDVTPLSIGIETLGGVMAKIIPKNTALPTSKSLIFSTAADGQTTVEVNVLVGERALVNDNKLVRSFRLDGIPPSPRGVPQLQLKFDIDTNGVLSITALDKGTGKKKAITITDACTLPRNQIDEMVREAEQFAEYDRENKDVIETRNQANSAVYQTEKQIKDLGGKVPVQVKENIEAKLKELKDVVNSGGVNQEIKVAIAALNQELMQLGQSIYNQPRSGDGESA